MPAQDPVGELLDLVAVHGFYVSILQEKLGHLIPLPHEAGKAPEARGRVDHALDTLRRWLSVLDMAISPPLLRDALKAQVPHEVAEAMLRYYVDKASHSDNDRDKADCVITFLYRSPRFGAAHEKSAPLSDHDPYGVVAQVILEFESEIYRVLSESRFPDLKPEHVQLLREFEFLHQEVDDFRTFDKLMDSGIIQRVRDLKASFGESFYHPDALANIAVYNSVFGRKFDDLFRATSEQIKHFAKTVQQQGASIMSRIEGDVTVKHLADVEDSKVMDLEYGRAREQFRKISGFKKLVDKRVPASQRGAQASHMGALDGGDDTAPRMPISGSPADFRQAFDKNTAASQDAHTTHKKEATEQLSAPPMRAATNSLEEGKIHTALENIRAFVRVADPKACFVVPLVKGTLNITQPEADALRADFGDEKSFRADYANCLAYLAAMASRLVVEQLEFRAKENSAYLWKPHADSITYIINQSGDVFKRAQDVMAVAQQRGLGEKVAAMKASMQRLETVMQESAITLGSLKVQRQTV